MRTRTECIRLIKEHADVIRSRFGVTALRIFGSVAREQQTEASDVDICVAMPPRLFKLIGVGTYLEDLLGCHVDVVREHSNMNPYLKAEIDNDGIYVFG